MNAQELAQHPIKSIATLIDYAHEIAPTPQVVYMLRNRLFGMPDDEQRLCAAALDGILRENRQLREDLAVAKESIEILQKHGGLEDK